MTDAAQAGNGRLLPPFPGDLVSFSVICRPKGNYTFEQLLEQLSLENLEAFLPAEDVRTGVIALLRDRGFEVFDDGEPVVSARGPVELFERIFSVRLARHERTVTTSRGSRTSSTIVLHDGEDSISIPVDGVPGAVRITLAKRPTFFEPRLPTSRGSVALRVPGDVSQLTFAASVHRQQTGGAAATGHDVVVAVVDTGFANHPWYEDHGYRIVHIAAPRASNPDVEEDDHGMGLLAPLLSCAPDATVHAVEIGDDAVRAFKAAALLPRVRVVSLSWGFNQAGRVRLTEAAAALKIAVLAAVRRGVVVVAAGGNHGEQPFPALMPEVIAVGGLQIDEDDVMSHWPGSSHFTNPIYPRRPVPDLCAMAGDITVPASNGNAWRTSAGGTSAAAPQAAGVAALLLQKEPALTPAQVRNRLMATAQPVAGGGSAVGQGMVDALSAWNSV